jgi:hypothetical protein
MPTFEVTSPDGRKFRVTAPAGATQEEVLAYVQKNASAKAEEPKQERPQRSIPEELARQGGLGLRYVAEGAAGLAGIPANALGAAYNVATSPFRGKNLSSLITGQESGPPRAGIDLKDAVSRKLTAFGLPEPETGAEQLSSAVSQATVGAGPLVKGAQWAPEGVRQTAKVVGQMATRPGAELAATATGATASEAVRQGGGNEAWQMIAGATAPLGVSAVGAAAKGTGRAAREIARPTTKGGQEQIAADVLGRLAQDKTTALGNLGQYSALKELERRTGQHIVGVPGSKPTAGAVSADYGLIGGEQVINRGDASPFFAAQQAGNNAARIADLDKLKATAGQIAAYVEKRDQLTAPLRDAAFGKAKGNVNVEPVLDEIFRKFRSSEGQGADTQRALDYLYSRLEKAKAEGALHPKDLYDGLHKDINQMVSKGIDSENGRVRLASGIANDIKKKLADAIEEQAPGFKRYLTTYSRLSKPIERLEIITEKLGGENLGKVTNALPSATPGGAQFMLSQAKMRNAVQGIGDETKLAPRQAQVLERVLGDLNAETLAARGGKQPGSDTYQNMASANFVNRVLGQTLAESAGGKAAERTLGLLYKPLGLEGRIQDLIVEAYKDPEKMAKLLALARTSRQGGTLAGMLDHTTSRSTAGLLGSLLAQ